VNSFGNSIKSASTSNTNSNIMTREAYKTSQKNQLPQTANNQLAADQQAQANAQQAVDNFNADQAIKRDAANKAQQVKNTLEQAKKNTQIAQATLQTAKDQLTTDQKTQANAQKAVDNF